MDVSKISDRRYIFVTVVDKAKYQHIDTYTIKYKKDYFFKKLSFFSKLRKTVCWVLVENLQAQHKSA